MTYKQEVIDAAEAILNQNKAEWTPTEFAIVIQSQYYQIEELFTFGANYQGNDLNIKIQISEEIVNICCAFDKNLKLFPDKLSWSGRDKQIERVDGIYNEVYKALQLQRATKAFLDDPTPFNAMKMKMLTNQ